MAKLLKFLDEAKYINIKHTFEYLTCLLRWRSYVSFHTIHIGYTLLFSDFNPYITYLTIMPNSLGKEQVIASYLSTVFLSQLEKIK